MALCHAPRGVWDGMLIRSDSDINFVIMDYLVNEGYPAAAQKFASEANIAPCGDSDGIQQRVDIRTAIHAGDIQLAIERINELRPEVNTHPCFPTCPLL